MTTWRPARPRPAEVEPRAIGASLDGIARRLGVPAPDVLGVIFTRWEALVGPQVAAHATPLSLRDGVLVIAVDQPAWATQLRLLSADVLRRLAEVTTGGGEVLELHVQVRPDRR